MKKCLTPPHKVPTDGAVNSWQMTGAVLCCFYLFLKLCLMYIDFGLAMYSSIRPLKLGKYSKVLSIAALF
jgi:hypothetical protein